MNFIIQKESNFSAITVAKDRLDSSISPELKGEILQISNQGVSNIILDLKQCEYCDSSGLSAILVGNRLCEDTEGTFILCNLSPGVEKMIKMAMLDSILLIAPDLPEAKRLLIKKSELQ
jgi:anti-sigma B factor antagonist